MLKPFPELLVALATGQSPLQDPPHDTTGVECTCQSFSCHDAGVQLDPTCPVHPAPRYPQVN